MKKMSSVAVQLAEVLISERCGGVVGKVAGTIFSCGLHPLPLIVYKTKLSMMQVKKAMCVLCELGLVTFERDMTGRTQYRGCFDGVVNMLRVPRCIMAAKTLFGEQAEAIVEELASKGQLSFDDCVTRVMDRLENTEPTEVRRSFIQLVEARLIHRCEEVVQESTSADSVIPQFKVPVDPFQAPDSSEGPSKDQSSSRKRKADDSGDISSVLWKINHDRFDVFFRDQSIVQMIANLADEHCGLVFRTLLKQCDMKPNPGSSTSSPIAANQLLRSSDLDLSKEKTEKCLKYIAELPDSFLKKVGDSGGGMFVIDFAQATECLCQCVIESVVKEKFGSKALRIFRLLLTKKYLEQNEIENLAMLPSKEGKELTYQLYTERFIFSKEVAKTSDFAPSRTFYLFHVDLPMVARFLLEQCYKTVTNIVHRRQHEHKEHKSLVERQEKIDAIVANIQGDESLDEDTKEQQVAEIEEVYMTESEKHTLDTYRKAALALQKAEIEVEQTIFILQSYLQYNTNLRNTK